MDEYSDTSSFKADLPAFKAGGEAYEKGYKDGLQEQESKVSSLVNVCSYLVMDLQELKKELARHDGEVWPIPKVITLSTNRVGMLTGEDAIVHYVHSLEDELGKALGFLHQRHQAEVEKRLGWE